MPTSKSDHNLHNKLVNTRRLAKIVLANLLIVIILMAGPHLVSSSIADSGHSKGINHIDQISATINQDHGHHHHHDHHHRTHQQYHKQAYLEHHPSNKKHHTDSDRYGYGHGHNYEYERLLQQHSSQQQQQVIVANGTTTTTTTISTTAATTTKPLTIVGGTKLSGRQVANFNEIRAMRNRCLLAERELDRCSAQLIGMGQGSGSPAYPDNMHELNSVFCPRFRKTIACIKNNTDCYKPFERQIISWILVSSRKMNHKRCKNENEKARFIRLTNSCFTSMKNPMSACMTNYIGSLDAIADRNGNELAELQSEDDIEIKLACCANMRFKQCIMSSGKQMCKSHDSLKKLRRTNSNSSQRVARKLLLRAHQDTMDDLRSTLDEMALTGPEFICHKLDEKFCRTTFDGKFTNRLPRHESIVPAMIKIYANK